MSIAKTDLVVTAINMFPYLTWTKEGMTKEGTSYSCSGVTCHLVLLILHTLRSKNYTVELIVHAEKVPGLEASPGNWTSAMGMLARKEADIYGGIYGITPRIHTIADFSNVFISITGSVLSGPPMNLGQNLPSLFSAVAPEMWALLFVCVIVITFIYAFMSEVEASIYQDPRINKAPLVLHLLTFYGLLFQKGFENLPETLSRRILVSGWLFLVLIMTVELGGALSSKLAVEDEPERIDRIQDILKYPKIRPFIPKGVGLESILQASPDKALQAVLDQIRHHNGMTHTFGEFLLKPELLDAVADGTAVLVSYIESHMNPAVGFACQRAPRPFYLAKEAFFNLPVTGLYRKDLDHVIVEHLNQMYSHYGGMGFHVYAYKVRTSTERCLDNSRSLISYRQTKLPDIISALKVLGIGSVTSIIALILEIGYLYIPKFKQYWHEKYPKPQIRN